MSYNTIESSLLADFDHSQHVKAGLSKSGLSKSGLTSLSMRSNKSFHSYGLNYLFAQDDPDALVPSDETIFPKHVHNSNVMTVFLLLNTMIGSGILNQPQVFLEAGIIPATVMLLVTAFFTWLGMVALIDVGAHYELFDFSELAHFAFGKWGEILVDISIAIGNFGALLSYILVIASTSSELLGSWGCPSSQPACGQYVLTCILMSVCVVPVCLKRVFGELAFFSVLSMVAIGSVVLLTIVGGPLIGNGGPIVLSKGTGLLGKLGSIIFALSCSFASFHTYVSLHGASAALWRQLSALAMVLGAIMLFVIGIAGYLSFRESTEGIILDNFVGHYADVFRVLLVLHLILYIPVDFMTMRHSLVKLCGVPSGQLASPTTHAIVTIILLAGPTAFVLMLHAVGLSSGNAFGLILDFSGGLAGSITSFVMPGAFYLRLFPTTEPLYYPCMVMVVLGVVIAVLVPVISVMQYT